MTIELNINNVLPSFWWKTSMPLALFSSLSMNVIAEEKKLKDDDQPNIIIMFIDDMGYNDIGFRNSSFQTPNIDQLAVTSYNFTNAYVASPTSSPSRTALLTGRHPLKVGVTRHISNESRDLYGDGTWTVLDTDPGHRPNRSFLPLEEITIAEALKDQGYTTYHIGKWHLGKRDYYPDKQGFDHMFGESDYGHPMSYFPPYFNKQNIDLNGTYLNDYLTDQAVDWISEHDYSKAPLFMYFAHYAVHSPFIGQQDKIEKYLKQGLDTRYATYHAMIESMDESVGRVLNAIDQKGIKDNTVFMFISDQGGPFSNAPLRGGKTQGQHYDGGSKVPFFVRYKGETNKTIEQRISTLDVFPTLIEMAGVNVRKHKQLDGKTLLPIFQGKKRKQQPIYVYRSYDDTPASLIVDDYKYIVSRSGNDEFYDLKTDIGEEDNRIHDEKLAKQVKKMRKMIYGFLGKHEMPPVNN